MSTYEFIVSSRDSRPTLSDVESGNKSPASRKLFKVFDLFLLHKKVVCDSISWNTPWTIHTLDNVHYVDL